MTEEKVNLMTETAKFLKGELDERMLGQDDLCYRSAIVPTCVVLQLPGVCRGEDECRDEDAADPPDVFWAAERKVELPSQYQVELVQIDADYVETMRLKGPQVARQIASTVSAFQHPD